MVTKRDELMEVLRKAVEAECGPKTQAIKDRCSRFSAALVAYGEAAEADVLASFVARVTQKPVGQPAAEGPALALYEILTEVPELGPLFSRPSSASTAAALVSEWTIPLPAQVPTRTLPETPAVPRGVAVDDQGDDPAPSIPQDSEWPALRAALDASPRRLIVLAAHESSEMRGKAEWFRKCGINVSCRVADSSTAAANIAGSTDGEPVGVVFILRRARQDVITKARDTATLKNVPFVGASTSGSGQLKTALLMIDAQIAGKKPAR